MKWGQTHLLLRVAELTRYYIPGTHSGWSVKAGIVLFYFLDAPGSSWPYFGYQLELWTLVCKWLSLTPNASSSQTSTPPVLGGRSLLPLVACLRVTLVCPALGLATAPGSMLSVSSAAPGLQQYPIRRPLWQKQSQPHRGPTRRPQFLKMAISVASEFNRIGLHHLLICCATVVNLASLSLSLLTCKMRTT